MWNNRTKAEAIKHLVLNLGDVELTHEQTKIPKRTLQRWKDELKNEYSVIYWELDSRSAIIHERYARIRDRMIVQIERLLQRMEMAHERYLGEYTTAIARLTDRISKIEEILEVGGQYSILIKLETDGESNILDRLSDDEE